jgi:hypothetical protein
MLDIEIESQSKGIERRFFLSEKEAIRTAMQKNRMVAFA